MRAKILAIPETFRMGLLLTQEGEELCFEIWAYSSKDHYELIKEGDEVFIEEIKTIHKSVRRPTKMRKLSKEEVLILNREDVKAQMNINFKKYL